MLKDNTIFSSDYTQKSKFQYSFIETAIIKERKSKSLSFFVDKDRRNYTYNYTYDYNWVDLKENTIAQCKANDTTTFHLGTKKLSIIKKNKTDFFHLKEIKSVSLELKKMILPILVGGTVAPLTFLDILKNGNNTWWAITIAFGTLLLLYYGWRGRYQLKISLHHTERYFFIKNKNVCWENLITKINQQIMLKKK
jgi:hypothetical protein